MNKRVSLPSCWNSEDTPPDIPGQQDGCKHLSLLFGGQAVKFG